MSYGGVRTPSVQWHRRIWRWWHHRDEIDPFVRVSSPSVAGENKGGVGRKERGETIWGIRVADPDVVNWQNGILTDHEVNEVVDSVYTISIFTGLLRRPLRDDSSHQERIRNNRYPLWIKPHEASRSAHACEMVVIGGSHRIIRGFLRDGTTFCPNSDQILCVILFLSPGSSPILPMFLRTSLNLTRQTLLANHRNVILSSYREFRSHTIGPRT